MQFINENLLTIFTMVLTGGAVYGAIKTDLKYMHTRLDDTRDRLNERVDTLEDTVHFQRDQIEAFKREKT